MKNATPAKPRKAAKTGSLGKSPAEAPSVAPNSPASGRTIAHESALAQVAGAATYIDDMPELRAIFGLRKRKVAAHGRASSPAA